MYMLIRAYTDCTSMTERAFAIEDALSAAAIYLGDKTCCKLEIYDCATGKTIMNFWR